MRFHFVKVSRAKDKHYAKYPKRGIFCFMPHHPEPHESIFNQPTRHVGLTNWPLPLSERLDLMVDMAYRLGEELEPNPSRTEVVQALVADFSGSPDDIVAMLRNYRMKTVGDLYLPGSES